MQLNVSPAATRQAHHIFALNLLNVYLLLLEGDMLPAFRKPDFINRVAVRLLMNRMEVSSISELKDLGADEINTLYAACFIGNRLLASSKNEYISGMILQQVPAGHELKDYVSFREAMILHNEAIMQEAEQMFASDAGFQERKAKLKAFNVE